MDSTSAGLDLFRLRSIDRIVSSDDSRIEWGAYFLCDHVKGDHNQSMINLERHGLLRQSRDMPHTLDQQRFFHIQVDASRSSVFRCEKAEWMPEDEESKG